jgi:hypothetical protein
VPGNARSPRVQSDLIGWNHKRLPFSRQTSINLLMRISSTIAFRLFLRPSQMPRTHSLDQRRGLLPHRTLKIPQIGRVRDRQIVLEKIGMICSKTPQLRWARSITSSLINSQDLTLPSWTMTLSRLKSLIRSPSSSL